MFRFFVLLVLVSCSFGFLPKSKQAVAPLKARSLQMAPAIVANEIVGAMSPFSKEIAKSVLLPSSLALYKSEYGVSLGYGGSIAWLAWLVYKTSTEGTLHSFHCLIHMAYGIRLCAFFAFREMTVARFREVKDRIEQRAPMNRLKRIPMILSIALLYWTMSMPLFLTQVVPAAGTTKYMLIEKSLMVSAFGFALNFLGDTQKYICKAMAPNKIVINGLYKYLRHPNYTGELLLWGGSTVAGLIAASAMPEMTKCLIMKMSASIVGFLGISFVLISAATGLERRQRNKYKYNMSTSSTYTNWVKGSWPGPTWAEKPEKGLE
jgi:steroid 5-alpha reductase family enzyme